MNGAEPGLDEGGPILGAFVLSRQVLNYSKFDLLDSLRRNAYTLRFLEYTWARECCGIDNTTTMGPWITAGYKIGITIRIRPDEEDNPQ
jgi:hypothetical protein